MTGEAAMDVLSATPCVPLRFSGPRGSATALTWVDTGGGAGFLSADLARRLGVARTGTLSGQDPGQSPESYARFSEPEVTVAGFALDPSPVSWLEAPPGYFARTGAEAFLPARVLANYDVLFDYPARRFSIGQPGSLSPIGARVPAPVSDHGFCRLEVVIDGVGYGMLLDTGASHTMVSAALFDHLHRRHPAWPVVPLALGTANMANAGADRGQRMMRIPSIRIGPVRVEGVSVVTRAAGAFEGYMSQLTSAPIIGALAGNVLQVLRVAIEYRRGEVWISPDSASLPVIYRAPLNVEPDGDGFVVLESQVASPRPGDRLASIANMSVAGASFAQVLDRLSSTGPGQLDIGFTRGAQLQVASVRLLAT
ncbi:MAG TPA: retropepsin-like aspartic protease [Acidimicrobiales bacterium]|nr:retropepsin-like aspartic protease [Acidimicrobiales bacterium]